MASILGALTINTGTSSLKSIDGSIAFQDDICLVVDSDAFYVYQLEENNSSIESIPSIIQPNSNGTNKRWILKSNDYFNTDIQINKNNKITLSEIREVDEDGVIFTLENGVEICRIDSNGLIVAGKLTISNNNLDISSINEIEIDEFIRSNGYISFTNQIKGVYPISDDDLSTKLYVDDSINSLSLSGDYVTPSELDEYIKFENTTIFTPSNDYNPTSKKYVDDIITSIDSNSDNIVDEADSITGQGSLATLSEVTSAEISSESAVNTYVLTADGSGGVEGRGTIPELPQLLPGSGSLDNTDIGSSRGNAFSMIETIDFASGSDGAAGITFHFPSSLDANTNISLDMYYNLSGADDSKTVSLEVDYGSFGDTETPNPTTSDGTNSESISTGIGQDGQRQSIGLTSIPSTAIAANETIVLKVTRLGSTDTYTGTLQMLYIFPYQE